VEVTISLRRADGDVRQEAEDDIEEEIGKAILNGDKDDGNGHSQSDCSH
jgi:hypothetical protein